MGADLPCVHIHLSSTVHACCAPAIVSMGEASGVIRGAGAVGLALILEREYAVVSILCLTSVSYTHLKLPTILLV